MRLPIITNSPFRVGSTVVLTPGVKRKASVIEAGLNEFEAGVVEEINGHGDVKVKFPGGKFGWFQEHELKKG